MAAAHRIPAGIRTAESGKKGAGIFPMRNVPALFLCMRECSLNLCQGLQGMVRNDQPAVFPAVCLDPGSILAFFQIGV